METFLLISAIIITLMAAIKLHQFNDHLARFKHTATKVYPNGQPLYHMNKAGVWMAVLGGITTIPLVIGLIFTPYGAASWISTSGALGLVTLFLAALLLTMVFFKHCLNRKLVIKRILSAQSHQLWNQVKILNPYKVVAWLTGIVLFMAFFIELFSFLVYLIGFVAAAWLGMLDNVGDKEDEWKFNFNASYHSHDNDEYYYNP